MDHKGTYKKIYRKYEAYLILEIFKLRKPVVLNSIASHKLNTLNSLLLIFLKAKIISKNDIEDSLLTCSMKFKMCLRKLELANKSLMIKWLARSFNNIKKIKII
jgi:hypothetical protein